MQRMGELCMEHQVYSAVVTWMTAVPANSRYVHLPRWQLGALAYEYLFMSTAAWCPARQSAVRVAMQLFMLGMRSDIAQLHEEASTLDRRVYRAVMMAGVVVNPRDTTVDRVRRLSRDYRLERSVAIAAGEGYEGERLQRFRQIVERTLPEDVDSASDESNDVDSASDESNDDA